MLRMELQFYALFMTVLSGIGVGLLFDLLRAVRRFLRPGPLLAALGDLLFWGAATAMVATGLFLGNWGEYRFYVLVGMLAGLALHFTLASPAVLWLADRALHLLAWALGLLWGLALRLVWFPLRAVAKFAWRLARRLGGWAARRLRGPYRWLRLRYLLARRRIRRAWRRWWRGPKT